MVTKKNKGQLVHVRLKGPDGTEFTPAVGFLSDVGEGEAAWAEVQLFLKPNMKLITAYPAAALEVDVYGTGGPA